MFLSKLIDELTFSEEAFSDIFQVQGNDFTRLKHLTFKFKKNLALPQNIQQTFLTVLSFKINNTYSTSTVYKSNQHKDFISLFVMNFHCTPFETRFEVIFVNLTFVVLINSPLGNEQLQSSHRQAPQPRFRGSWACKLPLYHPSLRLCFSGRWQICRLPQAAFCM